MTLWFNDEKIWLVLRNFYHASEFRLFWVEAFKILLAKVSWVHWQAKMIWSMIFKSSWYKVSFFSYVKRKGESFLYLLHPYLTKPRTHLGTCVNLIRKHEVRTDYVDEGSLILKLPMITPVINQHAVTTCAFLFR